eukprot:16193410-Heterocapsa_arctica.AAC.1
MDCSMGRVATRSYSATWRSQTAQHGRLSQWRVWLVLSHKLAPCLEPVVSRDQAQDVQGSS